MAKVKICDIRTIDDAEVCDRAGADFIGIHQIEAPLTDAKKSLLVEISRKRYKFKIVLVTKEKRFDKLIELISYFKWDYVQLHFSVTTQFIKKLRKEFLRQNYKTGIIAVVEASNRNDKKICSLFDSCDYVLFDTSFCGGTGRLSSLEDLQRIKQKYSDNKFFIAGGLNVVNVKNIIQLLNPFAVDVQSGVESAEIKHRKDESKVVQFISEVKSNV